MNRIHTCGENDVLPIERRIVERRAGSSTLAAMLDAYQNDQRPFPSYADLRTLCDGSAPVAEVARDTNVLIDGLNRLLRDAQERISELTAERGALLEDAALLCESDEQEYEIGRHCAVAIRALKGKPAATTGPSGAQLAVPQGWKLVPTHPDQFMINAFIAEYEKPGGSESGCYRAMLAAAPIIPAASPALQAGVQPTRLDILSLIHSQMHRVYASAIDREEIDTRYMREIEDALRALVTPPASQAATTGETA